jgi:arsenate reductase
VATPVRVLFLCTANACRSQMAEGFARHYGHGVIEAYSAGTQPTAVHPLTVEVMRERGVDISAQQAKGLGDVPENFGLVVTVCDQAAESCPLFPGAERLLPWFLPDPAQATGTPEEVKAVFRRVRDEIEARVRSLVRELEARAS